MATINSTETTQPNAQLDTQELDSSILRTDKVFEGVINAISPKTIVDENKALIDAFVNILAEESPISVNILDVFSKNTNIESIANVQEEFARMYLNNFYYVWRQAKNDYKLRNRLEDILQQYKDLGAEELTNSNLSFFDDEQSMYTAERYIVAKTFKEKKGTDTAIEYAYKLAWLAGIEGPLRDAYNFEIEHKPCVAFSSGFVVCGSDTGTVGYPSPERPGPNSEINGVPTTYDCGDALSKSIGTFLIAETTEAVTCQPFEYSVEGSLLPEFYDAFVAPLAHPVGFNYIYKKILELVFKDYFNLEYVYIADSIGVESLCPDGDCSRPQHEIYAEKTEIDADGQVISSGGGITNSSLKYFESGVVDVGEFRNYSFEKYIMANESYLISYTDNSPSASSERVIQYFDIPANRANNLLQNSSFDNSTYWKTDSNSIWNIGDSKAFVVDAGISPENNRISQNIALTPDEAYIIQIEVSDLVGSLFIQIGDFVTYDDLGNVTGSEIVEFELTEDLTYAIDYVARGGEKVEIYTKVDNASFKIDNVMIIPNSPSKVYQSYEHSTITLSNLLTPIPILFTHDIFGANGAQSSLYIEDMNELYYSHLTKDQLQPVVGPLAGTIEAIGLPNSILGNMIINEFYHGQSTYSTNGVEQFVLVSKDNTVDYKVESSDGGTGTLRTRYAAFQDLGEIDLNIENFLDVTRWTVRLVNIDTVQDQDDDTITNEGGFVIGSVNTVPKGSIIPWGDPDTAYMRDELNLDRDAPPVFVEGFDVNDFQDPSKWFTQTDWAITDFGQFGTPELNYARIEFDATYATTGNSFTTQISPGVLVDYDEEVQGPGVGQAPFGVKGITYEFVEATEIFDLNTEDYNNIDRWKIHKRGDLSSIFRDIENLPQSGEANLIKVDFTVQFDPRLEAIQETFVELRVGKLATYDYIFIVNEDSFIPTVSNPDVVEYKIIDANGSEIINKYAPVAPLTNVNLKDGTSDGNTIGYNDGAFWVPSIDTANLLYEFFEKPNETKTIVAGDTIDVISNNKEGFRLSTQRYRAVFNLGLINFKDEDFSDIARWEPVNTHTPVLYTSSGAKSWMGEWDFDDIVIFSASGLFKGDITRVRTQLI